MANETNNRDLNGLLLQKLSQTESLLDVGSGPCLMLDNLPFRHIVALEIHRPYLINRATKAGHILPLNADAREIGKLFVPKSFSAVSFFDTLEHFDKQEGYALLREAEQIARSQVIIFTPRGFFPQQDVDHYGLSGETYQTHRSGWEPADLEQLGYEVIIMKGLHDANNPAFVHSYGVDHPPVDALLAIKYV
ncbi:class I SAM-dependent methyltransferase [Paenibacillus silvisoli]|uniref:class I SAM-dependent methyltransferase n=1 Tax=Paenibacillus silvisoli TaxID=3110539 RepID=UPI002805B667|nr:class I SAM-dependent methyltransferase [Paenibacillus silvisoli]